MQRRNDAARIYDLSGCSRSTCCVLRVKEGYTDCAAVTPKHLQEPASNISSQLGFIAVLNRMGSKMG